MTGHDDKQPSPDRSESEHANLKPRWKRIAAIAAIVLIGTDLAVLDRWRASGIVVDGQTGKPIAGAWVVTGFSGKKPLIRLPIPPHPLHRTSECMGLATARTDEHGRYSVDKFTYNRPLAEKSASLTVFKPGWVAVSQGTAMRTSALALGPHKERLSIARGPGTRNDTSKNWSDHARERLHPNEFTYSDELFSTLGVISRTAWWSCGGGNDEMLIAAMNHALDIATTLDERSRTRSTCLLAADTLAKSAVSWPFDCSNLKFTHQPSSEVLALEEEFDPVLRAAKRNLQEASP